MGLFLALRGESVWADGGLDASDFAGLSMDWHSF
jgi:hypothetical protein